MGTADVNNWLVDLPINKLTTGQPSTNHPVQKLNDMIFPTTRRVKSP
jgi:hypothetical protein